MAIPPILLPQGITTGMMPQPAQQPMTQPMTQPMAQAPQPSALEALNRALSGDLSASLTGGDRLLALAALMRSATRSGQRAGLTPQQVIGDLRQQQVQQAQARLQLEQLRAAEAQQRQQRAAMQEFIGTLPPEQQRLFPGLDAEGQSAMLREHLSPQPFQISQTNGEFYMTFRNGTSTPLNLPRNREIVEVDTGAQIQFRDKNTGEVLQTIPKEMSPYQSRQIAVSEGNLRLAQAKFDRGDGDGSPSRGPQPSPITVNDERMYGIYEGNFQYRLPDGRVVTAVPAGSSSSADSNPLLNKVVGSGSPRFGGGR